MGQLTREQILATLGWFTALASLMIATYGLIMVFSEKK